MSERIVIAGVHPLEIGETGACVSPFSRFGVSASPADETLARAAESRIIVNDDLMFLCVALSRSHHVCPGVFQHRNQEGEYIALCVQVLDCREQRRALPFPSAGLGVIIVTMALPKCYLSAAQSFAVFQFFLVPDDRHIFAQRIVSPPVMFGRPAVIARSRKSQLGKRSPAAIEVADLVMGEFCR